MKTSLIAISAFFVLQNVVAQTVPITGPPGGVEVRQDITVMQNAGPVFDLYILALQQFQTSNDTTSTESWFQIAGIHGLPQVPWDGESGTNDGGIGFCTHGSILFPSWHRPYISIYEQQIWSIAQNIAQQYPDDKRDTYLQAAKSLRVPYWDWSMNSSIPDVANTPDITINTPQGVNKIRNPLFSYTWQNSEVGKVGTDTFRAKTADANLAKSLTQFHQLVYNMLTSVPRFDFFADANTIELFPSKGPIVSPNFQPKATWSVESIHNTIHQTVGGLFGAGGGTMGDLEIAAFEPLFWLHHANVDRVFAIWQAVYPDSYLEPFAAGKDSWWFAAGDMQDVDTPLLPFHGDNQGTNLTSTTVRNIRDFAYTYPELKDSGKGTAAEVSSKTRTMINQMYNPLGQIPGGFEAGKFNCSLSAPVCQRSTPGASPSAALSNAADHQWVISMNINESILNETITIAFFLDTPSSNPLSWATDSSAIAVQPILIKTGQQTSRDSVITRSVFLTHALISSLPDLSESSVLPYLQGKLQWRATWSDGSVIDAATMEKLQAVSITVNEQSVEQTPGQPDAFPIYGEWVSHGTSMLGSNSEFVAIM